MTTATAPARASRPFWIAAAIAIVIGLFVDAEWPTIIGYVFFAIAAYRDAQATADSRDKTIYRILAAGGALCALVLTIHELRELMT